MRDFYASSRPAPLDQADGLRRLFGGRRCQVMPLVANPHVAFGGVVLDRVAAVLAASGRQVLVVDASAGSPPPHELAALDLAAGIERLSALVHYLPARGLPRAHVDTRGCAGHFIDALLRAAPQAEAIVLHAESLDLARMFRGRAARPILLGADHPESIKHAYAACKLLVQRCGLMTFDLLLAAAPNSPRATPIAESLAGCADNFLGATLLHAAVVDPAGDPQAPAGEDLAPLLAAQLALDDEPPAAPLPRPPVAAPAPNRSVLR